MICAYPTQTIGLDTHSDAPQLLARTQVEFSDGVVKAEVGEPDMRKPIQYAVTAPDRIPTEHRAFDPAGLSLQFEAPDTETFPCLELGYEAGRSGGTAPAVLNAADEVAVAAFLEGRIRFADIPRVVQNVLDIHDNRVPEAVADVEAADGWARRAAEGVIATHG